MTMCTAILLNASYILQMQAEALNQSSCGVSVLIIMHNAVSRLALEQNLKREAAPVKVDASLC